MASPSHSADSVPPSTPLPPPQPGPPLPPPLPPPQPTLAPIAAVSTSPPQNPIDSFYAQLDAEQYKFAHLPEVEPEHPPKVAATSKAPKAPKAPKTPKTPKTPKAPKAPPTKLKILMNGKDLAQSMAEAAEAAAAATAAVPATPKTPKNPKASKAPKAPPIKLKILMNGKELAQSMAEAAEAPAAATAAVPTPGFKKPTLPVNVEAEAESAVDLLNEMYNQMVESVAILEPPVQLQASDDSFKKEELAELMLLVEEACDAVAFAESRAAPAAAIDVRNGAIIDLLHRRRLARNIFVTHKLGFPRMLYLLVSNKLISCMQWITPDAFAVNDLDGVKQLIQWGFLGRMSDISDFSFVMELFGFVRVSRDDKIYKHKNDLFIEGRQDLLDDIRA